MHAWEMSPDVSGIGRGHRGGLGAWDPSAHGGITGLSLSSLAQEMESKPSPCFIPWGGGRKRDLPPKPLAQALGSSARSSCQLVLGGDQSFGFFKCWV